MKKLRLLVVIILSGLIACQHNTDAQDNYDKKQYNRAEAAALNTQLGLAYLKKGNQPRAKKKLLMALSQAPESPNTVGAMAYFLEKTGDQAEAENYYKKALALSHQGGAQLNNYGAFLCRHGYYGKADAYFLRAVKDLNYSNTAGAYENAGFCAMEMPDVQKAAHYFTKALEQDSSRKQSLFELVSIQLKKHEYNKALGFFKKYPKLVLSDKALLKLATETAAKAGNPMLATDYNMRLQQLTVVSHNTGVNHEYSSNNG